MVIDCKSCKKTYIYVFQTKILTYPHSNTSYIYRASKPAFHDYQGYQGFQLSLLALSTLLNDKLSWALAVITRASLGVAMPLYTYTAHTVFHVSCALTTCNTFLHDSTMLKFLANNLHNYVQLYQVRLLSQTTNSSGVKYLQIPQKAHTLHFKENALYTLFNIVHPLTDLIHPFSYTYAKLIKFIS